MTAPLLAALLCLCSANCAALALTEQEAVRIGLRQAGMAALADATLASAQADVDDAGRWPNPVIDVQRETMRASPQRLTERSVVVSQQIDVSGRRRLQRGAATERLAASQAELAQRRVELAGDIRMRFYEVIYRDGVLAAAQSWETRMAALARTVQTLHQGGEVTGYDRRRVQLELSGARSRVLQDGAAARKARERLRAVLGADELPGAAAGELMPVAPVPLERLGELLARRPQLQALARRARSFDFERQAAGRGMLPEVTVGLGRKRVEDGAQRDSGTVVSLSVPLPLFDRRQGEERRAAAQAAIARSDAQLAHRKLEGELRGAWHETIALIEAARAYRLDAGAQTHELTRIAEAAYRGGETNIVDLLDAYQSEFDSATRTLELTWNARQAALELDTIAGTDPL